MFLSFALILLHCSRLYIDMLHKSLAYRLPVVRRKVDSLVARMMVRRDTLMLRTLSSLCLQRELCIKTLELVR